MTTLIKTLVATTATLLTLSGSAFADAHALDVGAARLDTRLDTDGDGDVSDDEIIMGNMALFDVDGSGTLDATERDDAEEMLMSGSTIDNSADMDSTVTSEAQMTAENFNARRARLDTRLDINGNGDVDDDEIINGNMQIFDKDGNGTIDADERGEAMTMLKNS